MEMRLDDRRADVQAAGNLQNINTEAAPDWKEDYLLFIHTRAA
jgi:hypothetical protein